MSVENKMETIKIVNLTIGVIFLLCYLYQLYYVPVALLKKEKPRLVEKLHNYAVLISARNEEKVIASLIESINKQSYPLERITVFVVADNCTDNTAEYAACANAVVYERHNHIQVGKGYALSYLLEHIVEDYGIETFDGYFVFDADNILDRDYISEMNKVFSDGYHIITSYRNSKNYGDNWISAGYGLWFLRESRYLNNARMLLNTSCAVSGTGFVFSREILRKNGGWKFFLLTEDIEFSVHSIINGEKIGYCKDAVIYDEQPTDISQSWNQRLRWSKGYLQVFQRYGYKLMKESLKGSFSSFDMSMTILPAVFVTIIGLLINLSAAAMGVLAGTNGWISIYLAFGILKNAYFTLLAFGLITTVTEWKNINTKAWKKILYVFTFPIFMLTYIPITIVAVFKNVEWKPISHNCNISIDDIRR